MRSTSPITGAGGTRPSGRRIPAGDLEGLVINRIRTFLADPGAIPDAADDDSHGGPGRSQLVERSRQIAEELGAPAPDKVKATLRAEKQVATRWSPFERARAGADGEIRS